MKKHVLIIASIALFVSFFLSSCFGNKDYEKKVEAEHKEKVENKLDSAGGQMNDVVTNEEKELQEAKENFKIASANLEEAMKNGKTDAIKAAKEAKQKADDKLQKLNKRMKNDYN